MSKWRFEVVKQHIDILSEAPKYLQFSNESVFVDALTYKSTEREALEVRRIWSDSTSETPRKVILVDKFYLKGNTYGNCKGNLPTQFNRGFAAERIGRMFPRHKQQIIYKGDN